jgi:hypothetical protein
MNNEEPTFYWVLFLYAGTILLLFFFHWVLGIPIQDDGYEL